MRLLRIAGVPALVIALMLLVAGSSQTYAQNADSAHINQLLTEAEHFATLASRDGEDLESFTRSNLQWESHAHQLNTIREHVNHLGEVIQQLNEARDTGSPWQQQAIDEINPLAQEMATQLTATIQHLSDNPARIHMKPYRDLARTTYEVNERAAAAISDYVEYAKAKAKADAMDQKMGLKMEGGTE